MNERVANWLRYAQEDLESAKILLKEGIYNKVCFHCQQSIENGLKALLVFHQKIPPKVHSLVDLLRLVINFHPELERFEETCRHLDLYYLPTRYPDAVVGMLPNGLPTEKHAQEALDSAEVFLGGITNLLR